MKPIKKKTDSKRSWQTQLFFISYAAFMVLQYPIAVPVVSTLLFYMGLFPAFLLYVYAERRSIFSRLCQAVPTRIFLCLFLYGFVHAIFLTPYSYGLAKTLSNTIFTTVFFLATLAFFADVDKRFLQRFLQVTAVVAGVCAFISIVMFYMHGKAIDPRLIPIGRASHPILGAFVYATAGLMALYCIKNGTSRPLKWVLAVCFLAIFVMILLTQSRMAIAAFILSVLIWLMIQSHYRRKLAMFLAVGLPLATFIVVAIPPLTEMLFQYFEALLARGDSFRLALWQLTLHGIYENPLVGNGMRTKLDHPAGYLPHNIYLATAFYIGIPGFLVFMTAIALTTHGILKLYYSTRQNIYALGMFMLLVGLLSGVTDHAQFVKGVSPLWIIFWMPVAMVIGLEQNQHLAKKTKRRKALS